MPMRLKTLNGAPLCANLDFSEETLLDEKDRDAKYTDFLRGVVTIRCAREEAEEAEEEEEEEEEVTSVKWRHLTDSTTRLQSGWSQPFLPAGGIYDEMPNFSYSLSNLQRSFDYVEQDSRLDDTTNTFDDTTIEVDNFRQYSLLLHDTLLSSQITPDTGVDTSISFSSFLSTSFGTFITNTSSPTPTNGQGPSTISQIPPSLAVTSLNSLPSPHHLRTIYPQTLTRNVVCVLTLQPERREVVVRNGGYRMQIYEIVVADDTKSDFKVSFWFRPPKPDSRAQDQRQEPLRSTLERAKVGDVLLLRNVVLNVFRENVYGQSLNASITRARTTVEVLKRGDGFSAAQLSALPAAVVETFVRVKRWANVHVVPDYATSRKRRGSSEKREHQSKRPLASSGPDNETLPPDTMET